MSTALLVCVLAAGAAAAPLAPYGVSYPGWKGGYSGAAAHLDRVKAEGFTAVTFVPNYALMGLDRVEFSNAPTPEELASAVGLALERGLVTAVKPHLEPGIYSPGFNPLDTDNHGWRAQAPWRGFFDVDPMARDYREGVALAALRAIAAALERAPAGSTVRLDVGSELMHSETVFPEGWERLLRELKRERRRLGLDGKVLFSHNFAHHIEIPEDMVLRMDRRGRAALGRYIRGLDAVALSQYMDLTEGVPAAERRRRDPTPDEVADALGLHERRFVDEVLIGLLGIPREQVPPLWIGEFGIGRGGLRHPNVWSGEVSAEEKARLERESAIGHAGLIRFLRRSEGRLSRGGVLWTTGPRYDIFGWGSPSYAVAPAAEAVRRELAAR